MTGDIQNLFLTELEYSANIGCWCYEIMTNELFWSDQTYKIHGVDKSLRPSVAEAINFYHPDDRKKIKGAFDGLIASGQDFRLNLRIITTQNKIVFVESFGKPIYDNGKIVKVFGTFKDISEKVVVLSKVKKSVLDYKHLLGAIKKCFIVAETDKAGLITGVNDNFIQISGYSNSELVGQNHRILSSGYHDKSFFVDMWKKISHGEIWHDLICNRAKDGQLYWVQTFIIPKLDEEKVIGYIAVRYDVTAEQLQALALENEKNNAELSAQLAAVGEMSAGIAHEINNPLTIIFGKASMLKKKANNPESVVSIASDILNSSDRIKKIIKGLHHLAQKSRGGEHQRNNLIGIINYTFDFCREALASVFIDVTFQAEESDILISCDEVKISQILLNLINNARDAILDSSAEEKWIRIDVKVSNGLANVFVYDSGPGVKEEYRDKIMNAFFTTKKVGKGTGLGLSLVARFLDEHGGKLEIISNATGNGFMFNLPIINS